MTFNLQATIAILERTPPLLHSWLNDLPEAWTQYNEGPDTWSPYDVMGHLIHGEKTDWIPRAEIILSNRSDKTFIPFDRFAQLHQEVKHLNVLLKEFSVLREENIQKLKTLPLNEDNLKLTCIHPKLGTVTLAQLLSTWTVHDLGHIAQIARVMAKQYGAEVGPWQAYLNILK